MEALEQCFEGIGGITTIVHVCRSYPNPELEKSGFHYKSDQGYYPYVLDLVRESKIDQVSIEARSGVRRVQFDDPGLMRDLERAGIGGSSRSVLKDIVGDHDYLGAMGIDDAGARADPVRFEGIGGITTIVHVCRSYPNPEAGEILAKPSAFNSARPFSSMAPDCKDRVQVLAPSRTNQTKATIPTCWTSFVPIEDRSGLDRGAYRGALNARVLEHLGEKTVLLGCVDVSTEQIEAVDDIRRQAERALKHVHPGQLVLAPDCGLVLLSRDAAKGKLSHLARAAGQLNGNL